MKIIKLKSSGLRTKVDDEDYAYLKEFNWCAHDTQGMTYVQAGSSCILPNGEYFKMVFVMHKILAGGLLSSDIVDHLNGDTLDNRKCNLRITDHAGNARNRISMHPQNRSGVIGVAYRATTGRWIAQIGHNYKGLCRSFATFEEAVQWRSKTQQELRGEVCGTLPSSQSLSPSYLAKFDTVQGV